MRLEDFLISVKSTNFLLTVTILFRNRKFKTRPNIISKALDKQN